MSIAQTRLDAYIAAEAKILARGASLRLGDRQKQEAELREIRLAISQLQGQIAREASTGAGGSLKYRTAVFNS